MMRILDRSFRDLGRISQMVSLALEGFCIFSPLHLHDFSSSRHANFLYYLGVDIRAERAGGTEMIRA